MKSYDLLFCFPLDDEQADWQIWKFSHYTKRRREEPYRMDVMTNECRCRHCSVRWNYTADNVERYKDPPEVAQAQMEES